MATVLLLNGPNLNLLGTRETSIYGSATLESISDQVEEILTSNGHGMLSYQSNHEGTLIEHIQQAQEDGIDFILFNPAGYTHTSVALRDALLAVAIPFIEIHLSEPKQRESFRHHSYFTDIAVEMFSGHGVDSYLLAAEAAVNRLTQ